MVGLTGSTVTKVELAVLRECPFGGFILFKHNCSAPEQIRALCDSLWKASKELPPFIAIDQEGGEAHRLPKPFTRFPVPKSIGDKNDSALSYRLGRAQAEELALVGINVNFAPVLDVNSNPKNPVIGARSFGSDPEQVIKMTEQWIQGTRDAGIIPCGKHFPGHGDTDKDSHRDLPSVNRNLDSLRALELPPFVHACRKEIESLMTAHVIYSGLDAEFPASLSRKLLTGLLRGELGYDGVVFSDAMEMKAISDNYGDKDAGALAIRAGIDVLLYSNRAASVRPVFEFVCNEAERDAGMRHRIEESYERIVKLKRRYLNSFSGVPENEIADRLARLDHQRIIAQLHEVS